MRWSLSILQRLLIFFRTTPHDLVEGPRQPSLPTGQSVSTTAVRPGRRVRRVIVAAEFAVTTTYA